MSGAQGTSAEAAMAMPPPSGFRPASSLPRPSPANASSSASLRNASGGQPAIARAASDVSASGTSTSGGAAEAFLAATNSSTDGGPDDKAQETQAKPAGPSKPVNRPTASKNAIVYNAVQRRNPVMHAIKNVPTEIGDIPADFQVGVHSGVLFLSLKYHRLHPEYIHQRIEKMKNMYNLRIVMVLCDVSEHQQSLREISKIAVINELTVFVAWSQVLSNEEVAQYLATFKAYEHKSADTLKERVHQSYHEQLQHALTSGRKVNKTDADNLASQFGSFANIARQPAKALAGVKGLGATKVTSLVDAFTKPFIVGGLKRNDKGKGKGELELERADIVTSTAQAALADVRAADAAKGKERARDGDGVTGVSGSDHDDREPSPDWPDEEEQDDQEEADMADERASRRARAPSRSPGLSPDNTGGRGGGDTWKDPLDDDDDGEDGDDAADSGEEGEAGDSSRTAKRPRMS